MNKFTMVWFWLLLPAFMSATTYFHINVEEVDVDTITQGENQVWELDVAQLGNKVTVFFIKDMDMDHTWSEGDKLLEFFQIYDGESGDDGPGDSDPVPDGVIEVDFGPMGFLTGNFVLRAEDMDGSSVEKWVYTKPIPDEQVSCRVIGNVSFETVTPPSSILEDVTMGFFSNSGGIWMTATDNNGNFQFDLPSFFNGNVQLEVIFDLSTPNKYVVGDDEQEILISLSDDTLYVDTTVVKKGNVKFEGMVTDRDEFPLGRYLKIETDNWEMDYRNDWYVRPDGQYEIYGYVDVNEYVALELDEQSLLPEYMVPNSYPDLVFDMQPGDSLVQDFMLYPTNDSIFVQLYQDDVLYVDPFVFFAGADSLQIYSVGPNLAGFTVLPVTNIVQQYWINAEIDEDYLPEGMMVIPWGGQSASPTDTVDFHLINYDGSLNGSAYVDFGDPFPQNISSFHVAVFTQEEFQIASSPFEGGGYYWMPLPNGNYNVLFQQQRDPQDSRYAIINPQNPNIIINNDNQNVGMDLAYLGAEVSVTLTGTDIDMEYGLPVENENYPNMYIGDVNFNQAYFSFYISPGTWTLHFPMIGDASPDSANYVLDVFYGQNSYEIEIDYSGGTAVNDERELITAYSLMQNYPNPFNPSTIIKYQLKDAEKVELAIFNSLGQKVTTLVNGEQTPGSYTMEWDASAYSSGIYYYRLKAGSHFTQTRKMVLMR